MIRALIFDMDGTLVNSEKVHYAAWEAILKRHAVPSFSFASFASYVGVSNEQLAEDAIRANKLATDVATLVREKQELYLEMIPDIEPQPGVRELLERSRGRYRLAVASSSDTLELHRILKSLELGACFEQVVGGDQITRKKPHPEIYTHVTRLLCLAPPQCVAFEDSQAGIAAANSAGLFSIAVPNSLSESHDFSLADRVLPRIDQADELLLQALARSNPV